MIKVSVCLKFYVLILVNLVTILLNVTLCVVTGKPKVKEFRIRQLQFEEKLDVLFLGNTSPPFHSSSIGSALHGADWETKTVGDTGGSLNCEENAVISEIKSFKGKGRRPRVPKEALLDHGLGSNLSSRKL